MPLPVSGRHSDKLTHAGIYGVNVSMARSKCCMIRISITTSALNFSGFTALWMRSAALRSITMLRFKGQLHRTRWARCRWTAKKNGVDLLPASATSFVDGDIQAR